MSPHHDVAIIGAGAAGLSAALVLTRAGRDVVVLDSGRPRNAPSPHLQGFLSRDGMSPAELLAVGRAEVTGYGGRIIDAAATALVPDGARGFWVLLDDGRRLPTRRILVATGLRDELPAIPGLTDRWARDVLHCPYCHGYEVRGRPLGVIGGTADAVRYAQIVRQWTDDLVYFTPPDRLTATERNALMARAIGVVDGTVSRLVVDDADRLTGVRLDDGTVIPREVLFVPPRMVPNSALLAGAGCQVDAGGWAGVDATGRTSVAGIWAAGNVVDPRAQVITAAGAGSAAAIAINADLVEDDIRQAVQDLDHGLALSPTNHPSKECS